MANVPYVKIEPESDDVVRSSYERGLREVAFWAAHRADLAARFPDEFVAVTEDGELVAHSPDLLAFVELLKASGFGRENLYSNFLADKIRFVL